MIYLAPLKTWVVDILEEREKNPNKANTKMPFVIMTSGAKVVKSNGPIKTKEDAIKRAKEILLNDSGVEYKGCIISNQNSPSLNYSLSNTVVGFDFTGKQINALEVGRRLSMPIIESLDINTDGVNNTLKVANITVRCFSLKQFEMFELFFCKAGMHILVEYGDNSQSSLLNQVMINKSNYDVFVATFKEFTKPTIKQFGDYLKKCEISKGTYDRVAGKLINYSYSIEQDGTYSVQLEVAQSNEYNLALPKAFITKYKSFDTPSADQKNQWSQWTNKLLNDLPGLDKKIIEELKEDEWKNHFFNWGKINEDEIDKTASNEPYLSLKFVLEVLANNTANQGNNPDFILFKDDYFKIQGLSEKIIPITVHNNMISADSDVIFPNENLPEFTFDEESGKIIKRDGGVVDGGIGFGNKKLTLIPNKEISFTDPLGKNTILEVVDIKKDGQKLTDLKIGNALNIFISYKVIGEAWERNTKNIDFIVDILDRINKTSFGLFKLRIGSLYEGAPQTVIDTKLYSLNTEQLDNRKQYRFKPTTINSNVRDFKFNFELTDQVAAATIFNSSKFLASAKLQKEANLGNSGSINLTPELYQSIDYSAFSTADGYFSINEIEYQQIINTKVKTNNDDQTNIKEKVDAEKDAKRKSYDNFQNKFKFKKGDIRTLIYEDYSFINTILGLNTEDVRSRFELVTPIKVNLTIDGISGITCGETFRIDGIPEQYNKLGQFQITNTKHVVNTDQGWTTEIEGEFRYGV
jgi:hypothetical protein